MKLVIVQLSDIHISTERWPDNPILSRGGKILDAARSMFLSNPSCCLLLISGDVAYAGLAAEYQLALTLLAEIQEGLRAALGCPVHTILLPGNHDCDFTKDNAARKALIKDPPLNAFGDGSVPDICTALQDEFFALSDRIQGRSTPLQGMDRLVSEHQVTIGSDEVLIRTINTAWCSQIKEQAATLLTPAEALKPYLSLNGSARLVVTAFHHPYWWLEPSNGRALRKMVESSSDLVFTGHEHVSESYSKTGYTGEHNEYIEAGPLQENGSPQNSEFNIVTVDADEGTYAVTHFVWTEDSYESVVDVVPRQFIRNNSRLQSEFEINDQFREELSDTDTPYAHPFKEPLTLEDIYVYPDLREFTPLSPIRARGPKLPSKGPGGDRAWSPKKDDTTELSRRTIRGRTIIDQIIGKQKVVISAQDRAGKTALCRTLFKDLWKSGKLPLLLSAERIDAKVTATIQKHLDSAFAHQYRGPKASAYWQLDISQRAVIIDDYHKMPNVSAVREKLIEEIGKRFGIIVLVGGSSLRFQEFLASEDEAGLIGDFVNYDIMAFGLKLRSDLLRKWFVLNRVGMIADDVVAREVAQLEKVIGLIIGRDLLPPFPAYLLLLLQQLEIRRAIDTSAASYGKLYQSFLTDCLAKRHVDIETAFSYLSELAFTFFKGKTDHFSDHEAIEWHNKYVAEYSNAVEYVGSRDLLVNTGLLDYRNGQLRFRVKGSVLFLRCAVHFVPFGLVGHAAACKGTK